MNKGFESNWELHNEDRPRLRNVWGYFTTKLSLELKPFNRQRKLKTNSNKLNLFSCIFRS